MDILTLKTPVALTRDDILKKNVVPFEVVLRNHLASLTENQRKKIQKIAGVLNPMGEDAYGRVFDLSESAVNELLGVEIEIYRFGKLYMSGQHGFPVREVRKWIGLEDNGAVSIDVRLFSFMKNFNFGA